MRASLDSGAADTIAAAVDEVTQKIWSGALSADEVGAVLALLEERRRFSDVVQVAEAGLGAGAVDPAGMRRYCQSLIELGALHAAELALSRLVAGLIDVVERGEALGLLGRLWKQRYLAGGRPEHLAAAVDAYRSGFELDTDPAWHGVNLLALLCRAERDGVPIAGDTNTADLARTLLGLARRSDADLRSVWERSTEIEALVALGTPEARAEAMEAAELLAVSSSVTAFELESLRRQLRDVWQLDPTDPVLLAVADRQLQLGRSAEVALPDTPGQLEKIFGTYLPIGYENLRRGLRCAESVCKITDTVGEPWGTGFLVAGSLLAAELGDGPILVTNAHVCSPEPGVGKLLPEEAVAVFDVTKSRDGSPLVLTGLSAVWTSVPSRCDVTLLRFGPAQPDIAEPLTVAAIPQPVTEGAFVYVIGHPAGAGLKFSIRGNDLLAYDADQTRVHYTAPTEGGSSGSPVFNQAWQLMAIHHSGDAKMRRFDDPNLTYQANEGITIAAIRKEYAGHGR